MAPSRKKVLIVEDEPILLNAMVKGLEKSFEVTSASDGKRGLALALKQQPDIILLDILMPEMDGMAVLRELRGSDWGRNVRVIILTNIDQPAWATEAAKLGVVDFLTKNNVSLAEIAERTMAAVNRPVTKTPSPNRG